MSNRQQGVEAGGQQERRTLRGVKLLHTLEGHRGNVYSVAFDPTGRTLASGGDLTVKLWDVVSGKLIRTLSGHSTFVQSVVFDQSGTTLASGGYDQRVKLWEPDSGRSLRTLQEPRGVVYSISFDPAGRMLATGRSLENVKVYDLGSGGLLQKIPHPANVRSVAFDPASGELATASDQVIRLWDAAAGKLLRTLEGHKGYVINIAYHPAGRTLASGSQDNTVRLWDAAAGRTLRTLEGHTGPVEAVCFSADGRLLASKSGDGTLRLWNCETWETVAVIPEPSDGHYPISALALHPTLPLLATTALKPGETEKERFRLIHVWELNLDVLLGGAPEARLAMKAVHHTTAKAVLVGDHGVGKSGLGWRLAHGEFKEQASTHGQQFWVLPQLGKLREDGTECEAILWDLAGQPDYRLIHALFLEDVDLALVLFDASDISDPLHGVEFWLKQLKAGEPPASTPPGSQQEGCRVLLVGALADRGTPALTLAELEEFCRSRGISGYVVTSAKEGWGLDELIVRMKDLTPWERKPATVTTVTFKRIKDYVLRLKEERQEGQPVIVMPRELRQRLEQTEPGWQFSDAEMLTAVGHLENYGYVRRLRTSEGQERVLLAPELLNNLAASFVLEARRNPKGLGSLEEKRLLAGEYCFPEPEDLSVAERDILTDSAALLFLKHNVCFRETDPLGGQSYLVFPELINLKKPPPEDEQPTADGAAYTVSGAVENVYASLVVLLGYTQTFTRTDQWRNQARYVMGDGSVCGFRQEQAREGELDFVLYFGAGVPGPGRKVFEGLFESFLARRKVTVFRYEPAACPRGHALNRAVVRERLRGGKDFAFCEECGERALLPKADEQTRLTQDEQRKVDQQRWVADRRTQFEQAVFRLSSYVEDQKLPRPECFISYAWGDGGHEHWVEKSLATDLRKAGLRVLLDRWENSRIGSSVMRFVERIEECDYLIVVGTPLYRKKAKNTASPKGSVAAAEWDMAGIRMLAAEAQKKTVMPVLLAGEESESFPALLRGNVYADFRDERAYFAVAFDLILSIYDIPFNHQAVADLRESLRESRVS